MNLPRIIIFFHGVVPTRFQTYFIENSNNQIFFPYDLTVYGLIDYVGQSFTVENKMEPSHELICQKTF